MLSYQYFSSEFPYLDMTILNKYQVWDQNRANIISLYLNYCGRIFRAFLAALLFYRNDEKYIFAILQLTPQLPYSHHTLNNHFITGLLTKLIMDKVNQSSTHYKLAIVLLNYKTPLLVIDCMASLVPEIEAINAVCCIVDNDSQDGSAARITEWINQNNAEQQFYLIESKSNDGFSAGNNIGIRDNSADYYLLLNSDTLCKPGSIKTLLNTADGSPRAGMITPRLVTIEGIPQISCFRFPTPYSEIISVAKTGFITKLLHKHIMPLSISEENTNPPWACFASILIRKKMIDEIGLLDEGYFMYFEDIDYCYYARKAGWDILNIPSAKFVHLSGGSSSVAKSIKNNTRLPRYYMAARSRYFYKTGGRQRLLVINLAWYIGRTVSKLRELLGHSRMVANKQALDIWINWRTPKMPFKLKKR